MPPLPYSLDQLENMLILENRNKEKAGYRYNVEELTMGLFGLHVDKEKDDMHQLMSRSLGSDEIKRGGH